MSRIDDLIAEHCPDGVEFVELGNVIRLNFGARITKRENLGTIYPVYGGGGESFRTNEFNREDEYVVSRFAMSEACVRKVAGKFWMLDSGFTFDVATADVLKDFVAYWLLKHQADIYACSSQGAQKNLKTAEFKKFRVPTPPLEVQREIVKVLDTFTQLEAELEAELEARRRQYKYYRDALLTFDERTDADASKQARLMAMGEIGKFIRGRRFTKDDIVEHGIPGIHYGEIYTHYGVATASTISHVRADIARQLRYAQPNDVVIAAVGETVEDVAKAVAWLGNEDVAIHDDCFLFRHSMNPKFVSYCLQTEAFHTQKNKYVARAKVKRLSGESLAKIRIPVPPLEEQERIVAILDKFDALVNDLSSGLPAEIKARRQQYEHYRDRLLTFREAA